MIHSFEMTAYIRLIDMGVLPWPPNPRVQLGTAAESESI